MLLLAARAPVHAESPAPTVGPAERVSLKRTVEQPGRVEPFEQTPIQAKIAGFVKAVRHDVGDAVAAGEVLVELDVPELEQEREQKRAAVVQADAEVEQSKAALAAAEANRQSATATVAEAEAGRKRVRANYDRWKGEAERVAGLVQRNVIDEGTRDETRNQYRAAEAALEEVEAKVRTAQALAAESAARRDRAAADVRVSEAKAQVTRADEGRVVAMLTYTTLRAPFAGVVTDRAVDVGHLLQPAPRDRPLMVVTRRSPVRVIAEVPEADAAGVGPGAVAAVRLPALPGRVFAAPVTRSAWALDARTRTLRAVIDLPNPADELRPGMYANVRLTGDRPPAWTLPNAAVVRTGDTTSVVVVENGIARRAAVQVGATDGMRVEVVAVMPVGQKAWRPVTGAERFALTGAAKVADGQAVK